MISSTRGTFERPLSVDAVWVAMPLFVIAVRTLLQPIPPEDYWWSLVWGRLIATTGTIPSSNLFLFTMPADAPFFDQPWLAQWLMYLVVAAVGHLGMLVFHTGILVGTWGVAGAALLRRGCNPIVVGLGGTVAYYVASTTLMPRTQMFAYPCFLALLLLVTMRDRREVGSKLFWAGIAAVTAFWANVHGTFVLAPLVVGAAALGFVLQERGASLQADDLRAWGGGIVAAVVGSCASPHGAQNLLYPLSILQTTKGEGPLVLEWMPPGLYPQGILFYAGLLGAFVLLLMRRREVRWAEVLVFGGMSLLALTTVRGVVWWALTAMVVVLPHVSAVWPRAERDPSSAEGWFNLGVLVTMVGVVAATLPGMPIFRAVDAGALFGAGRSAERGEGAALSDATPWGLADEIGAVDGRIYHDQAAAGFVEWTLTTADSPRAVAFVDQRLELVEPEVWSDYFAIARLRPGWREAVARHEVRAFLLRGYEHEPLIAALESSDRAVVAGRSGPWTLWVISGN